MKKYKKSENIHPCRLERDDLLRLIEIIEGGFTKDQIQISTDLTDVYITSNNIKDFLKHDELPEKLNQLSIYISGSRQNGDKRISLGFYKRTLIGLDVSGLDQAWVLGKYAQITDFLKKKKPWFWILPKYRSIFLFFAGVSIPLILCFLIYLINVNEIVYSISGVLFLITWISTIYFYYKGTFLPYTQIILTSTRESFLNRENITFLILLLTLIFTIVGALR